MSYLSGTGVPDFNQAVISLWFRVPSESMAAAAAQAAKHKAEVDAAGEAGVPGPPPPPFNGIIPILTFGKPALYKNVGAHFVPFGDRTFYIHSWIGGTICRWDDVGPNEAELSLFELYFDGQFDYMSAPSFIGVDCKPDIDTGIFTPRLVICIQTQDSPTMDGGSYLNDISTSLGPYHNWIISHLPGPADEGCGWPPYTVEYDEHGFPHVYAGAMSSSSTVVTQESAHATTLKDKKSEFFCTLPTWYTNKTAERGQKVSEDHWHHLLISFDFSLPCVTQGRLSENYEPNTPGTVSEACKLWVAFDNHNLTKKKLSFYWPETGQDNDFLSTNASWTYYDNIAPDETGDLLSGGNINTSGTIGHQAATCEYLPSPIFGGPIGIPSMSEYTDKIRKVEMAELQIFTALAEHHEEEEPDPELREQLLKERRDQSNFPKGTMPLDLSIAENRLPFIHSGKPTPPDQKPTAANQYHPGSIAFMGMDPVVLFHGSRRWIKGDNTGTPLPPPSGLDTSPPPPSDNDFTPTGEIKKYKPDPSLGGAQGEQTGPPQQPPLPKDLEEVP